MTNDAWIDQPFEEWAEDPADASALDEYDVDRYGDYDALDASDEFELAAQARRRVGSKRNRGLLLACHAQLQQCSSGSATRAACSTFQAAESHEFCHISVTVSTGTFSILYGHHEHRT